jgi:DNA uptake protein ComE-like DNA-binding protein
MRLFCALLPVAAAPDLESQLEITADEAGAIVKYRQAQGRFKDFSDLAKVPGLDFEKARTDQAAHRVLVPPY